jgi:hypothetical protein
MSAARRKSTTAPERSRIQQTSPEIIPLTQRRQSSFAGALSALQITEQFFHDNVESLDRWNEEIYEDVNKKLVAGSNDSRSTKSVHNLHKNGLVKSFNPEPDLFMNLKEESAWKRIENDKDHAESWTPAFSTVTCLIYLGHESLQYIQRQILVNSPFVFFSSHHASKQ